MNKNTLIYIFLMICITQSSCQQQSENKIRLSAENKPSAKKQLLTGAEQYKLYLPLLKNKKVGLVVNQTARVKTQHLVDFLLRRKVKICKVFAPEHGFRGDADAGEHIQNAKDVKTGLPIISLYGKNKRPTNEMLKNIDIMIFDIQDIGVRFYTYISSLHYVMDACAEYKIPMIILDRPNPNGSYVAGPVLDMKFRSFVGMHPIPVVHGLTIGELGKMINGEGWLSKHRVCELTVIPVSGWEHSQPYSLPVKPSPNLPNDLSIQLYPSLCFFEPTTISIGRGTYFPFQVIGYPDTLQGTFSFMPESIKGMSVNPKYSGITCYGEDLRKLKKIPPFTLKYLIEFYRKNPDKKNFFKQENFFNLLAGNDILIKQIIQKIPEQKIIHSWQQDLDAYKHKRKKYLLYP
ncbi:DUF1343 domain-containing protein [bacterium]|nr:DUF1343 domain-containing protein [bacterium]